MSEILLKLREVDAGYGHLRVVRQLSMDVCAGELVALLGPNGAGKTTALLTATGMLPPLGGELTVLGAPIPRGRPHLLARRGVAFVPEDRSLFSGLTVRENLRLGSRGGPHDIERAIEYFPALGKLLDRKAGLLSGGEQQMLAIGRAIVARPRLLIVDEVSLGLAPVIVKRILPVLRRITAETGGAVLIVEQHVEMALEMADRAYVLSHGDLFAAGPADSLARDRRLLESSYLGTEALDPPGKGATS